MLSYWNPAMRDYPRTALEMMLTREDLALLAEMQIANPLAELRMFTGGRNASQK